jgi:hypothetical protein
MRTATATIIRRLAACTATSLVCVLMGAGSAHAAFEVTSFDGGVFQADNDGIFQTTGDPATKAGSHPATGWTTFSVTTRVSNPNIPDELLKDVIVDLPPGLIGNPQAVTKCPASIQGGVICPRESQVGVLQIDQSPYVPVYLMESSPGIPASFKAIVTGVPVYITAKLRTGDDYGISALALDAPTLIAPRFVKFTFWGVPADPVWDPIRTNCMGLQTGEPNLGPPLPAGCPASVAGPRVPFLTLPTSCTGPMETFISVTSWELGADTSSFVSHDNALPTPNPIGNDHCEDVPFTPSVSVAPSSDQRDSGSGVDATIDVPSDGLLDPDGIAQSHLKKTVVALPEGVSINPSTATGLGSCSDAQLGLSSDDEPTCPLSSRIGSVRIESPVLDDDEIVTGEVVLRRPASTDPTSGDMLRMAIVARNEERGILVKLPGSATADPVTGRLVATFDDNPQLPFSHLEAKFKGGPRGVLAMPQGCGEVTTNTELTPWSGGTPAFAATPTDVSGDCSLGFAPKLSAGMSTQQARSSGTFSLRFSREDGEQWVDGLTAKLPKGLLASVKDVPLCTDGQAATGACPAASRIGTVDATAGSGDPFVLEQKGQAFLTEGYKGCAYGLAVVVPVIAGPFDGNSPETDLGDVVVRQSVCVDRTTAEVTATSDPLPTIWHGIPLRVRSVTVNVDRSGFMLNPSDCTTKQVAASLHSNRGATVALTSPFQTSGCANLPFKPTLALSLTGKRQVTTGKHPGIKAVVTQAGTSEAGIEQAVVRLPKSLALDPENAQALCEYSDGIKPDLENHCPAGSIVGRARAKTPLLRNDLVGNVYFVKNVRRDPVTGNEIRTLPMIVVALRGEIAVNLKGESSTTKSGKLVNTFASVPDAPISQFNLNIQGGKTGIIAVTRTRKAKINLCTGRHIAETDMDAQNGRRHDFDVRMTTPCTKKQTKAARRAAKRASRRG